MAAPAFVPPSLRVGDYLLRPFRKEDAAAWYAYLSDPRVTEHTSWPPITPEFVSANVAKVMDDNAARRSLRWALARGSDDRLVGSCGFNRWLGDQAAELAYDLAPECWRQGLMSAAVRAAVAWGFQDGALRRIEAFVMTTNVPSIGLLERTGFRREGMLPGYRVARGVPRDFYLYSLESHATSALRSTSNVEEDFDVNAEGDPPVACTLTPSQLSERRQTLLPGLFHRAAEVTALPNGIRLRFESAPGLLQDLATVMDQERDCCRFLRFALEAEPAGGAVVLDVTGPDGTAEMLRGLVES